jgi:hypothetical protein
MSKFILKKTYINLDMCIEDYYEDVKDETKLKNKITFTDNALIISKDVKKTRATIEEINEKTFKQKIQNSNSKSKKNNTVSTQDIRKD